MLNREKDDGVETISILRTENLGQELCLPSAAPASRQVLRGLRVSVSITQAHAEAQEPQSWERNYAGPG